MWDLISAQRASKVDEESVFREESWDEKNLWALSNDSCEHLKLLFFFLQRLHVTCQASDGSLEENTVGADGG